MGREEIETIAPAIAELRAEGLSVTGPHSADTLFHAEARRGYDAVIAMYHDQALIPLEDAWLRRAASTSPSGCRSCAPRPTTAPRSTSPATGVPRRDSFIEALKLAAAIGAARRRTREHERRRARDAARERRQPRRPCRRCAR